MTVGRQMTQLFIQCLWLRMDEKVTLRWLDDSQWDFMSLVKG